MVALMFLVALIFQEIEKSKDLSETTKRYTILEIFSVIALWLNFFPLTS